MQKAQVAGDFLVEQAERMRHVDLAEPLQAIALSDRVTRSGLFAAAVECKHSGLLERTRMKGAGRVSQVVRHKMPFQWTVNRHTAKARSQVMWRAINKLSRRVHNRRIKQGIPGRAAHVFRRNRFGIKRQADEIL